MSLIFLRYTLRSLLRAPAFTIAAGLTLVVGIGAAASIFAIVNRVLLEPLPYGNPERLVAMWHDFPTLAVKKAGHSSGTYLTYRKLVRSIDNIGIYQEEAVNVADPDGLGEPQRLGSAFISASFIPTLQTSTLLGRIFTESEDIPNGPNVAIISHALWRSRFGGDSSAVGRSVEVNGLALQIIGVMPQQFRFPSAATQLWLPLRLDPNAVFTGGFSYDGVARLKPGVTIADAQREFAAILPRMVELFPAAAPGMSTQQLLDLAKPRPVLTPMRDAITGRIAGTLWAVAAAAGLVLLVAIANVATLTLVRADARQRELAVREALGAGRARLLAGLLAESAVIAVVGAAIGLGVAWFAVRALVITGPAEIPRLAEVTVDSATVVFTLVVATFAAMSCGIVTSLHIRRVDLATALRSGSRSATTVRAQHRLRGAMVAVQIALAFVVLAGSGLLLRTFQRLHSVRPGFDATNIATFWLSLPGPRYPTDSVMVRFYSELTARVAVLPGVLAVGMSSRLPLVAHGMNQSPFYAEHDAAAATRIPPLQIYTTTDGGYFRTMGIPVLAGRTFHSLGTQRREDAIISQRTAMQFWNDPTGRAAVGKRFRNFPGGPWHTIVGVVGDVRDTALSAPPPRTVYVPLVADADTLAANSQRTMALVVRTAGDPTTLMSAVRHEVGALDPSLPTFDVRPMTGVLRASMAQLSFTLIILGAATAVTLLLGAIGLYGVMAYLVALRTRELGLRIALGAQPRAIAAMMTRQGLALTAIGTVAGLVLFALVGRFLRSFLFAVAPSDPLTLAGASLTLVVIATLATWIPARRASHADPADALRAD